MTKHDWAGFFTCLVGGGVVGYMLYYVRYYWRTRRQPIWPSAPTGNEPWIDPRPRR